MPAGRTEGGPAWLLDQGLHGEGLHPLKPELAGRCPGKSPDLVSGWTGWVEGRGFPSSRDGTLTARAEREGPSRRLKARTRPAAEGGVSQRALRECSARPRRPLTSFVPHLLGNYLLQQWSRRCAQLFSFRGVRRVAAGPRAGAGPDKVLVAGEQHRRGGLNVRPPLGEHPQPQSARTLHFPREGNAEARETQTKTRHSRRRGGGMRPPAARRGGGLRPSATLVLPPSTEHTGHMTGPAAAGWQEPPPSPARPGAWRLGNSRAGPPAGGRPPAGPDQALSLVSVSPVLLASSALRSHSWPFTAGHTALSWKGHHQVCNGGPSPG